MCTRHIDTWASGPWGQHAPFSLTLAHTEAACALTTFLAFGFMEMVP